MLTPEIKITFRRDVCHIYRDLLFFTQLPYLGGCVGGVNSSETHGNIVRQVRGIEFFVFVYDFRGGGGGDAVADFGGEAFAGTDEDDSCVGFEDVDKAPCGDVAATDDEDGFASYLPGEN